MTGKNKIIFVILLLVCACFFQEIKLNAEEKSIHIVLDPGHGGNQSGADRGSVMEKDINLKIAKYLKEELSEYEGVTVSLTRDGDYEVELLERTEIALDEGAELLVSLHNNAAGPCCPYTNGCTVLVAKGDYKEELAQKGQKLACNVLYELEKLGLENQGMLLRDSESGETYEDGSLADYYAIIRNGVKNDLPSILIEHAFMDDEDDFNDFLSSDEELKALARADARGIARYYQLRKKESREILPILSDYPAKHVYVHDGDSGDYDISHQMYYEKVENKDSGEGAAEDWEQIQEENTGADIGHNLESYTGKKETLARQKQQSQSPEKNQKENSMVRRMMIAFVCVVVLFIAGAFYLIYAGKRKRE